MLESNIKAVKNDVQALVTDAQALFNEAAVLTGAQAEEARNRGMRMLDAVLLNVQEKQACALDAGKKWPLRQGTTSRKIRGTQLGQLPVWLSW